MFRTEASAKPAGAKALSATKNIGAFALLGAIFVALAVYGVWGIYNFYMPTVAIARDFSLGIVAVSVLAGFAGFFSPCAFGMLPSYFGFYAVASPTTPRRPTTETALRLGVSAAAGMALSGALLAVVVLMLGPAFALGLRIITPQPNEFIRTFRLLLALGLILLGVYQFARGHALGAGMLGRLVSRVPVWDGETRGTHAAFFLYGVAYLLASIPCTSNVIVAPLLFSFATGGVLGVAGTIILITLTMGVLMIVMSLLFALSKDVLGTQARLAAPEIQRAAGVLVIAMGLAIIYFTLDTRTFFLTFWRFQPPGVP